MMEELGVMQPHQAKELWQPPEPGRGKKWIHLLRECGLLTHGFQHRDIGLDFWPPEMGENKFLFFQIMMLVVICYSRMETNNSVFIT